VNASPNSAEGGENSELALRAALIDRCRLSAAAVDRITETMHNSGQSFTQSAVNLAFVTDEDIELASAWLAGSAPETKAGLIESAIRKLSSQRQVIVRPGDSVKPGPQLLVARDSNNPRSEMIRSLRTELLLRNQTGRANVVCVVSPSPEEGRSQLSAELAIAFAQLGRRTLLVDADLRKPSQHRLFPAGNEEGLGDSLMKAGKPRPYRVDGLPQMSLLTTGTIPSNPLELISSGRLERLLTDWRNENEFVVIDTPPAKGFADALAIATLAGRVLVVARAKRTSYKDTREMLRKLATTRAQVLGAALNHF
jgi:capsular exopolysaccharide synthesis family protein